MEVGGQLHARPLYPRRNCPRYTFGRRLGGAQSRSGRYGEEHNITPAGIRTPAILSVARYYTY
jgi:hypothetical protein